LHVVAEENLAEKLHSPMSDIQRFGGK